MSAKVLKFPSSTYRIESGIPVPTQKRGPKNYPFMDMAPGDSFFVPAENTKASRLVFSSVSGAAHHFRKKHAPHVRFTTRAVDGGVRCWRVK